MPGIHLTIHVVIGSTINAPKKVIFSEVHSLVYHSDIFRAALEDPSHRRAQGENTTRYASQSHSHSQNSDQIIFLSINRELQ